MGKYNDAIKSVLALFGTASWTQENIKTFPGNYVGTGAGDTYIRVHVIPSGAGLNRASVSGQLLIDIFTPAGKGPLDAGLIADKLDAHIVGKSLKVGNSHVQFPASSSMSPHGLDKVNPALFRSTYAISFNHFGV